MPSGSSETPLADTPDSMANNGSDPNHDASHAGTIQKPFRFMDLAPELREKIYRLAMPEPNHRGKVRVADSHPNVTKAKPCAMTQVCRAVRQEALAVYFSDTTFEIRVSRRCPCTAGPQWLADQDETAVSCMRKLALVHCSNIDHGEDYHFARIYIDVVQRTVELDEKMFSTCAKCLEEEVVPKIIKQIQEVVDGIPAVEGRKRLTKEFLGNMISLAEGMCIPD